MKIVMTLLVRDEEDILRENLDFHLSRGVDEFILMDNLSVDRTAEIAREYQRAGLLHYLFQPQDDYSQSRWVTEMARRAARVLGADWVINSDADEFWWPHGGSLRDALSAVPGGVRAASVERTNFVARADDGRPFWRRMDVREAISVNTLGSALPPKVAHRGLSEAVVAPGNHSVSLGGEPLHAGETPITILHYPVRTRAQFSNKIAKGGAAYARNTEADPDTGRTWRELYRLQLAGRFDEAYASRMPGEDAIAAGLADGSLVRDERLIAALSSLRPAVVA